MNSIVAFTNSNNLKSIKLLKNNNFIKDERLTTSQQEVVHTLENIQASFTKG